MFGTILGTNDVPTPSSSLSPVTTKDKIIRAQRRITSKEQGIKAWPLFSGNAWLGETREAKKVIPLPSPSPLPVAALILFAISCPFLELQREDECVERGLSTLDGFLGIARPPAAPFGSFHSAGAGGFMSARTAIKEGTVSQIVHSWASAASVLCSLPQGQGR